MRGPQEGENIYQCVARLEREVEQWRGTAEFASVDAAEWMYEAEQADRRYRSVCRRYANQERRLAKIVDGPWYAAWNSLVQLIGRGS